MKNFFKSKKNILICLLGLLVIYLIVSRRAVEKKYSGIIARHTDTIAAYMDREGRLYASNTAYITDMNGLKAENKKLHDEIKELTEHPLVVTEVKAVYIHDSVLIESPLQYDTTGNVYTAELLYTDEWANISGNVSVDIEEMTSLTVIDTLMFKCDFTADFIEREGELAIIAKSDNPYIQINNLNGYFITPEDSKLLKKRFSKPWGVMAGVGVTTTYMDGRVHFVPGVNITVGYKIINF